MSKGKQTILMTQTQARMSSISTEDGVRRSAAHEAKVEKFFEKGKKLMKELNHHLSDFEKNHIKRQTKKVSDTVSYYEVKVDEQEKRLIAEMDDERELMDIWEQEQIKKIQQQKEKRLQEKEAKLQQYLSHLQSELDATKQRLADVRHNIPRPKMLERAESNWNAFKEDWGYESCGKFPFFTVYNPSLGIEVWDWNNIQSEGETVVIDGKMYHKSELQMLERSRDILRKVEEEKAKEILEMQREQQKTKEMIQRHNSLYSISDSENPPMTQLPAAVKTDEPASYSNASSYVAQQEQLQEEHDEDEEGAIEDVSDEEAALEDYNRRMAEIRKAPKAVIQNESSTEKKVEEINHKQPLAIPPPLAKTKKASVIAKVVKPCINTYKIAEE